MLMQVLESLEKALQQKEQALIQYIRYMREAQDSQDTEMAALFADLAKAEEKHITVIRDQVTQLSGSIEIDYEAANRHSALHRDEVTD